MMVRSTKAMMELASSQLAGIGLWTFMIMLCPIPKGKLPYSNNFQELLMVIGTTKACGIFLSMICKPVSANFFGFPSLLRVPSGKITAE